MRPKKEAGHSTLLGGSFNEQGCLCTGLVLGGCKMSKSLSPLTRVLKVYVEA